MDQLFPRTVVVLCSLGIMTSAGANERPLPSVCTYEMRVWNVSLRSTAGPRKVRHDYADIGSVERDEATGCTVCSEDQVTVSVPPLPEFSMCYKLAPRAQALVRHLVRKGALIRTIRGYQVIRSRGPVDGNGDRTGFSNHSFGTAIDINPEQNGLYDNCRTFGPQCRLLRGGEWRPGAPGTLTSDDDIVRSFKAEGFKWGGEIEGGQKDFMHFSLTGY